MSYEVTEWINLFTRWLHVFSAILWIGQTYLFIRFDRDIEKPPNEKLPDNSAGQMWMVHGGGFFVVEKLTGLNQLPFKLHWFKREAMLTWLSGATLLIVLYYMGGLVAYSPAGLSTKACIAIGSAAILLAWPVYELLWRSPLGKNEAIGSIISFGLVLGVAYGLYQALPSRAAYLHVGAMLGTIMVANVWLLIIPAQKQIVRMMSQGKPANMNLARRARQSSKQNSYMSVGVVFIMLSSHFPVTSYGSSHAIWVLGGCLLLGALAARILRAGWAGLLPSSVRPRAKTEDVAGNGDDAGIQRTRQLSSPKN